METEIIIIYVLCAEYLQAMGHHEDPQVRMSDAEVMTTSITAAIFFSRNMESARTFLKEQGYKVTSNIVFQDNTSAILLEKNGKRSSGE